jgi:hypothetical protein
MGIKATMFSHWFEQLERSSVTEILSKATSARNSTSLGQTGIPR